MGHLSSQSIPRRRPTAMQKRLIPRPEPMPILLNQRRRHRRIPEPRMLFHTRRFPLGNIAPSRFESSVIPLPCRVVELRRRGRRRVNNHRPRMGTSRQCHGQQQSSQCNPLLHFISSRTRIPATKGFMVDARFLEPLSARSVVMRSKLSVWRLCDRTRSRRETFRE